MGKVGGKREGSGGKPGNLNAVKNGTRLTRLILGELPANMHRQIVQARAYRRMLEDLVMTRHGEVNATKAHLIDEATQAEVHASVCRWLLRSRIETMSTSDIARCSEQVLKAKTIRNKAVERLELDQREDTVLDVLYANVRESIE